MTNEEAIEILKGIMDDDDNHNIAWAFGASDAFEMAIEALEKQIPKKPTITEDIYGYSFNYYCPECVEYMGTKGKRSVILFDKPKHCSCGQAIDWSE